MEYEQILVEVCLGSLLPSLIIGVIKSVCCFLFQLLVCLFSSLYICLLALDFQVLHECGRIVSVLDLQFPLHHMDFKCAWCFSSNSSSFFFFPNPCQILWGVHHSPKKKTASLVPFLLQRCKLYQSFLPALSFYHSYLGEVSLGVQYCDALSRDCYSLFGEYHFGVTSNESLNFVVMSCLEIL